MDRPGQQQERPIQTWSGHSERVVVADPDVESPFRAAKTLELLEDAPIARHAIFANDTMPAIPGVASWQGRQDL
jgi:hypothetical protein